ncbi:MAG: AAA family ATPase [Oscillospiraceae bacterium]|nr:AAA family ATPase [Oscillospiraceae bacterium]
MGKVIVMASGKGGTGKTTAVGVVASCLAVRGYKTLCIDCDVGMRNLDMVLGMSESTSSDFGDVLSGDMELEQACRPHPGIPGLYFLSAPATASPEDIDPQAFSEMLSEIRDKYDYCLIDAPAGVGSGFRLAGAYADMGIIVTTDDLPSLRDGQRAAQLLRQQGIEDMRLIVNRVRPRHLRKLKTTVDDAIDSVAVQLIGVVYEDQSVILAANTQTPLIKYTKGSLRALRQFMKIAGRIAGEEIPVSK